MHSYTIRILICFSLITSSVHANPNYKDVGLGVDTRLEKYSRANEYYSEIIEGEVLIPVHVLGGVNHAGLYHIPKQTDLIRLLALSGGTRPDADLHKVVIKRRKSEKEEIYKINVEDFVESTQEKNFVLEPNDIVLMGVKEPFISPNTLATISLVTTILGIVVSSAILANQLKR